MITAAFCAHDLLPLAELYCYVSVIISLETHAQV